MRPILFHKAGDMIEARGLIVERAGIMAKTKTRCASSKSITSSAFDALSWLPLWRVLGVEIPGTPRAAVGQRN